jgi:hypothetical protein
MGWATGTFGLFGLSSNEVSLPPAAIHPSIASQRLTFIVRVSLVQIKTPWLNYLGISLAVASVGVYAFVKPTVKKIGLCSAGGGDDDQFADVVCLRGTTCFRVCLCGQVRTNTATWRNTTPST